MARLPLRLRGPASPRHLDRRPALPGAPGGRPRALPGLIAPPARRPELLVNRRTRNAALALASALALPAAPLRAQTTDSVPAVRLAAREWFREARFGLFIHWGVYSLLGRAEWVMQNQRIPVKTYEWLASTFDPVKFDAHDWVALAKAAGVRYITITSRHHDGFSMFATRQTPYNIVNWTRF
ncbi:MAG: hypothetical protein B7Z72_04080, partial [Gemmatimonadetes bacterium 21-71-4]